MIHVTGWTLVGFGLLVIILRDIAEFLIRKILRRKKDQKFLRFIRLRFPDAKVIEAITVADSDREAIDNLERRLRDASRTL